MEKFYDFAIVGLGAAGIHLLKQLTELPDFHKKSLLIIEKDQQKTNDKTWSFWEKGVNSLDHLLKKQWNEGAFITATKNISFDLGEYNYKSICSKDFYNYARKLINSHENIHFLQAEVIDIHEFEDLVRIQTKDNLFQSALVFDSRISDNFLVQKKFYPGVSQHFLGWVIETVKPAFDASAFIMMDYRIQDEGSTNFMYVLPFSESKALLEFTYFSNQLVGREVYEEKIKEYLEKILQISDYQILEKESGIIPMSTYPFENDSTEKIIKIGTAGGFVKASSGYSFQFAAKQAIKIKEALTAGKKIDLKAKKKFKFYDRVFLKVLEENNEIGQELFENLYSKNPIHRIFRFLDNESNLLEDLQIICSLSTRKFLPKFLQALFGLNKNLKEKS